MIDAFLVGCTSTENTGEIMAFNHPLQCDAITAPTSVRSLYDFVVQFIIRSVSTRYFCPWVVAVQ